MAKEDKAPVIYFGIANYVQERLQKYIELTGEPVAFCEKDENMPKFRQKKLYNKYEVLSLDEALKKYPNAEIWVTYEVVNITAQRLLEKLPPERIHFLEADLEYRRGCNFLGHFISYRVDNFSPCCISRKPTEYTEGSIPKRLSHWRKYTEELIEDIKNEKPNPCDNCRLLKWGFWEKKVELKTLCLATNNPGDVCNFRCTYCIAKENLTELKHSQEGYTTYEIIKQFSKMPKYDTNRFKLQLTNGEFCANKYCDKIFDILLQNKWKVSFVSNLSIYNEKFAQFLKTGRTVEVISSLDAGTRETFKKIKQVDAFDKVIENLKKYPFENVNLILKYIFLEGVNDNEVDVDGFLKVVEDVGCKRIMLSSDAYKPFTPKIKELAKRMINKAKQSGIIIGQPQQVAPADDKFIKEEVNKPIEKTPQTQKAENKIIPSPKEDYSMCIGSNAKLITKENVFVDKGVKIELLDNSTLEIHSCHIKTGTTICAKKSIKIGKDVTISENCHIADFDKYVIKDEKGEAQENTKPVIIKDRVFIAENCIILKGVTIGEGSIIEAGSVVYEDIPPKSLVRGNPAKVIKENISWEKQKTIKIMFA